MASILNVMGTVSLLIISSDYLNMLTIPDFKETSCFLYIIP
jgi:hypothetical protein